MTSGIHFTAPLRVVHLYDRVRATARLQGNVEELNRNMAATPFGDISMFNDFCEGTNIAPDDILTTGGALNRANGGSGELELEITGFRKVCVFGYDFTVVSKPIMAFRYNGETNEQVNERARKLQAWQDMRGQSQYNMEYTEFQYYDGNKNLHSLTGHDLDIAKKIVHGIESFDMYIPVITCTRTSAHAFTDKLNYIGHPDTPAVPAGWSCHGDPGQLASYVSIKPQWVKTADVISTNPDSSFTRREQWTGVDELDYDLYPPL